MIKLMICSMVLLAVAITADRLDNIYLPPSNSRTAGGSGNILIAPYNQRPQIRTPQSNVLYDAPQQPAIKTYSNAPQSQPQIAIVRLNNNNNGDGTYQFDFETENRISQQESGQLKNAGTDQESNVVQGSYSYVGVDGKTYTVNYIADELGFRATGDHLPTAPSVPEEILKSLEQNAAEEARGIVDDGQYRAGASETNGYGSTGRQYLAPKVQPQPGYRY